MDEDKAATLAQLEKDLNIRQEQILDSARKRIDGLNEEANRMKMVIEVNLFDRELSFIICIIECPEGGTSTRSFKN